jgi:ABC-2 type transport system permease protein
MGPLAALVRTDVVLYFSNKRALAVTLAAPILIAAFFGAALGGASTKITRVPVAVVDRDGSPVSKAIVAAMKSDASFDVREVAEPEATRLVREGKVRAAVIVPGGFGDEAPKAMFNPTAKKPDVGVLYDPSQSMALALVKGLLAQHVMKEVSRAAFDPKTGAATVGKLRDDIAANAGIDPGRRADLLALLDSVARVQARDASPDAAPTKNGMRAPGLAMPFETRETQVAGSRDRQYNGYSHSFAGMGVQFVLFMGIEMGVGLLLMRRMGLWRRLRAAPVSRGLLLGSRVVSGTVIAAALFSAIYAAAIAFFGVRVDGSAIGFVSILLAFALLTSTFGLLIAALGRTPEATRGLAVLATLLLVMLGGAWIPTFIFPEWLQALTLVVPTRWAIDGLEAMTWRGQGLQAAWVPVGEMLAMSALFAAISVRVFAWEE